MNKSKKRGLFLVVATVVLFILPFTAKAETTIEEINVTFDKDVIYVGGTPFTSVSVTSKPEGAVKETVKIKWLETAGTSACLFEGATDENGSDGKSPMTSSTFENEKYYTFLFDEEYVNENYTINSDTVIKYNGEETGNYCIMPESDEALPSPMNITIVNGMTTDDLSLSFNYGLLMLDGAEEIKFEEGDNDAVKVYNKNDKLLFSVDKDGKITIAEDVSSADDINYEHTHKNGDKSIIKLHFDPDGKLPTYEVIKGANSTYNSNSDTSLVFRIDADFELFGDYGDVKIDGENIFNDEFENGGLGYTVESGSTVVTLSKKLLDSLDEGEHTLTVYFSNGGKSVTKFNVSKTQAVTNTKTETKNPKTGDNMIIYLVAGLISIVGFISLMIFNKKQMN